MAYTSTPQSLRMKFSSLLTATETITFTDIEGVPRTTINWADAKVLPDLKLNVAATPSASNPVEVASTAVWANTKTATGTSDTIDLTALPRGAEIGALDLTGKKLQGFIFISDFANTADIVISTGAVNGYDIMNSATGEIALSPGGVAAVFFPENTTKVTGMPDVGAADAEIDLASSMTAFTYQVVLFAG